MKSAVNLQPTAPFLVRLRAYLAERFPLLSQGVLIVSYYSSNQFVALSLEHPGSPVYLSPLSLAGGLMLLCLFFHLRVFDEHKDYAEDCRYFPERVLSRGVITLRELRALAAGAIALEFVIAAVRGPEALVMLGITFGFSLLMLKEFFVREWLNRRFILYAVSHMCIMPLTALTIYSFVTQKWFWEASPWYYLFAVIGLLVTFNWEISRKIRPPEDEIEGVESYSKIFGHFGAASLVLAVRVIDTGIVAVLGHHLGLGSYFYVALVALFCLTLVGYLQFRKSPTAAHAKRLAAYAGLYIVGFDAILALSIAAQYGISWR